MSGVGRKTSVYLTDDLAERVAASGVPLAELIRRGLDAGGPASLEETLARVVREQLEAWKGVPPLEKPAPADPVPASAAKRSRAAGDDPDEQQRVLDDFRHREADGTPRRSTRAVQAGRRVSAGTATAVFQPAGAEPVVTHPVPAKTADEAREQLDRTVARKSAAKGQCEHRVKSGSYCTRCGRLI